MRNNQELARLAGTVLFERPYSREMELQADEIGMRLVSLAGFDPMAGPSFFRKMMAWRGPRKGSIFDTHPLDETRLQKALASIAKYTPHPNARGKDVVRRVAAPSGADRPEVTVASYAERKQQTPTMPIDGIAQGMEKERFGMLVQLMKRSNPR